MRGLRILRIPALLTGCDTSGPRSFVTLTVQNFGREPASIQIDVSRSPDEEGNEDDAELRDVLPANTIRPYSFTDVDRLSLRAYRVSDLLQIFDDSWKPDDLRKLHDNVVVTVEP